MKSATQQVRVFIEYLEQNIRNKAIAKDHRMQNKLTECKIFELKYAGRNLTTYGQYMPLLLLNVVYTK